MREISLKTDRKTQLIEITDLVREALDGTNGASAALVYVPHTTAGVAINERIDPELVDRSRERVPARRRRRLGVAPRRPGRAERAVACPGVARLEPAGADPAPRRGLALGTYQGVFFCEFDGPRERKIYVTAL